MTDGDSPGSGPGFDPDLDGDGPTFEAPWQARAFAVAVAVTDEADLPWDGFQSRLVEEVGRAEGSDGETLDPEGIDPPGDHEGVYYRQWLAALERLLVEEELLDPGDLAERVDDFERGDRSAHEFVVGDPHQHADRLPEGHAEGSDHDHASHGEHGHASGHGEHDH